MISRDMKMRKGFFIDTNVIINYLLYKKIKSYDKLPQKLKDKLKCHHDFTDCILHHVYDGHYPFISAINLIELFPAITKETTNRRMYEEGIPFSYFDTYYEGVLTEIGEGTLEEIKKFIDEILSTKALQIHNINFDSIDHIPEIIKLSFYKLSFADKLIFYTALNSNCRFFVTSDGDFLKNTKLRRDYKTIIEIISPEEASQKIKTMRQSDRLGINFVLGHSSLG